MCLKKNLDIMGQKDKEWGGGDIFTLRSTNRHKVLVKIEKKFEKFWTL